MAAAGKRTSVCRRCKQKEYPCTVSVRGRWRREGLRRAPAPSTHVGVLVAEPLGRHAHGRQVQVLKPARHGARQVVLKPFRHGAIQVSHLVTEGQNSVAHQPGRAERRVRVHLQNGTRECSARPGRACAVLHAARRGTGRAERQMWPCGVEVSLAPHGRHAADCFCARESGPGRDCHRVL